MHKPESALEDKNIEIVWNCDIQTDRQFRNQICKYHKKDENFLVDFVVLADDRVKLKESVRLDNYLYNSV